MAGPSPSKISLVPKLTNLTNQLYSTSDEEKEQWSLQENKMFEIALARIDISKVEATADLWQRIASAIPGGKTASQAKKHYDLLAEDVASIEAGCIALPNYTYSDSGCLSQSVEGAVEGKVRSTSLPCKSLGGRSASSEQERRKGTPWTEDEHRLFLMGLSKYGKGDWRSISRNLVISRTPTQVASHAQKYYIRQGGNKNNRRSSIHDITPLNKGGRLSSLAPLPSCNQDVAMAMPPPLPSSLSPTSSSSSSLSSSSLSPPSSSSMSFQHASSNPWQTSSSSSSMSLQQASSNPWQTSSSSSMSLQQASSNPWQISLSSSSSSPSLPSPSSSMSFQQTPSNPWKTSSSSLSMTLQQASSTPWQTSPSLLSSSSSSSSSSTSSMSLQQASSTGWKTSSSSSLSLSSSSSSTCLQHASSTLWKTPSSSSTSLQKPSSTPWKTSSLSTSSTSWQASSSSSSSSSPMNLQQESLAPRQTLYSRPPFITNTLMPHSNFNAPTMQVPHIDRPNLPLNSFRTRVPPPYPLPRTTYAMPSRPPSMHQYYS